MRWAHLRRATASVPVVTSISAGLWWMVTAACHTMQTVPPTRLASAQPPPRVWVTRSDKSQVVLDAPQLSGDTLTGIVNGEREQFLLSQMSAVQSRESSPARTVAIAVAAGALTLGTLYYLEHRPDVGNAMTCTDGISDLGIHNELITPCCLTQDTLPC